MYIGFEECRIYCVEWKTLKANPARKSRDDRSPATGLSEKPVQSKNTTDYYQMKTKRVLLAEAQHRRLHSTFQWV